MNATSIILKLDEVWKSRSSSIAGFGLASLASLASPEGQWLLAYIHVPPPAIDGIVHLQAFLVIFGAALVARGVGALGGAKPTPEPTTKQQ